MSNIMHGHKNNLPFINFIIIATDILSSLISFSSCDDTTLDSIMVNSEATSLNSGTVKSISGTALASEN